MKVIKTLLLTKTAAAAATFVWMALPVTAHASEQTGVSCPAGTEATLSNGVLKCKKAEPKVLASICVPRFGKTNLVLNPTGSDTCLALGAGNPVPSVMQPPTPGIDPPASAFRRVVNQTAADKFVADVYVFPTGAIFVGDASHGVKCPSGFDSVATNNGRGLRCEDVVVKKAVCDTGWSIERHNGRDLCVMNVFGNRVEGQYTIPENAGYTGLIGNPETHGWNLDTDRSGNTDFWVGEQKAYRYPVSF